MSDGLIATWVVYTWALNFYLVFDAYLYIACHIFMHATT